MSTPIGTYEDIRSLTDKVFDRYSYSSFSLPIPLSGDKAESNKNGIKEKILKNRSQLRTEMNQSPETIDGSDVCSSNEENESALNEIKSMVDRLISCSGDDGKMTGFVFILAEKHNDQQQEMLRPVAGGIFEYLLNGDREIRGVWCRRNLNSETASEINKAVCVRLMADALLYNSPITQTERGDEREVGLMDRSISIRAELLLSFPTAAAKFVTDREGLNLREHKELGCNHSDNPTSKCKCLGLKAKDGSKLAVPRFYGIGLNRFFNQFKQREQARFGEDAPRRRRTMPSASLSEDREGQETGERAHKRVKHGRQSVK
eukprot:GHVN01018050.1.p1 GENE.GHVN01018050.1~~GHVN01018050.1.p1  ORF type:complete len:337 (-),score=84.73 GHVN01018050.1:336-1289(-)